MNFPQRSRVLDNLINFIRNDQENLIGKLSIKSVK